MCPGSSPGWGTTDSTDSRMAPGCCRKNGQCSRIAPTRFGDAAHSMLVAPANRESLMAANFKESTMRSLVHDSPSHGYEIAGAETERPFDEVRALRNPEAGLIAVLSGLSRDGLRLDQPFVLRLTSDDFQSVCPSLCKWKLSRRRYTRSVPGTWFP